MVGTRPYPTSSVLAVGAVAAATITASTALAVAPSLTPVLLAALPIVFAPLTHGLRRGLPGAAAFGGGALLIVAGVAASAPVGTPAIAVLVAGAWLTASLSHLSLVTRVARTEAALGRTAMRWFGGLGTGGLLLAALVVGSAPALPERSFVVDAAAAFSFLAVLVLAAGRPAPGEGRRR
jgi:hypothetical protein